MTRNDTYYGRQMRQPCASERLVSNVCKFPPASPRSFNPSNQCCGTRHMPSWLKSDQKGARPNHQQTGELLATRALSTKQRVSGKPAKLDGPPYVHKESASVPEVHPERIVFDLLEGHWRCTVRRLWWELNPRWHNKLLKAW